MHAVDLFDLKAAALAADAAAFPDFVKTAANLRPRKRDIRPGGIVTLSPHPS
ncbi:MAG TPA: hypothetical protein VHM90_21360 [Phycisphaerae bacterium]|jgi:hypothetical protein|nr:hypothetical protein [Phycisphaerae bacterium]